MEALVSRHEGTAIVKDVRKDIDTLLGRLYGEPGTGGGGGGAGGVSKSRSRIRGADRKGARMELKTLRKEARAREGKVVQEVLRSRDVVLATCVGAATHSLREEEFDLVVIDEAAQALEAACWIPILKGRRLVLAGDHKQLAPTVKSRKAEAGCLLPSEAVSVPPPQAPPRLPGAHGGNSKDGGGGGVGTGGPGRNGGGGGGWGGGGGGGGDGLGLTMFDRVLRDLGHGVCRMLNVQYRMNRDICDWASGEMYGGLLLAHPSVAERELPDLPHASSSAASSTKEEEGVEMWAAVMLLVDTTGCDMPEEDAGGGSRRNEREAEVAVRHVKGLLNAGVRESEVAVISPYNGQVNLLKRLLRPEHPGVEVRSVDGFQGGEKEAIVLSLVRSNAGKKVGFLADARRLNVAVTRAKRHVAIVCDAECCGSDPFIGRLLRHVEDRGEYRSALELTPETGGDFAESAAAAAAAAVAAVAAVGRTTAGGVAGRKGKKCGEEGEEEKLSDEEVLRRVQEFAEQEPTHDNDEEEKGDGEGRLELPPELTARQRALAHETAEWLGLGHVSVGEGPRRVLVLSRLGGADASGPAARGLEPLGIVDGDGGGGSSSTNDAVVAGEANGGGSMFTVLAAEVVSEHDADTDGGADSGGGGGGGDDDDDDGSPQRQQGAQAPPTEAPAAGGGGGAVLQGEGGAAAKGAGRSAVVGRRSAATTPSPSAAVGLGAAVARSGGAGGSTGTNALLANLHAERAARRPPAPPPGNRTTGGKGKAVAAAAAAADGGGADDRGFTVDLPNGGGGRGKKGSSKKGGSGSKKGKRKPAEGKAGAGAKAAAGRGGTITKKDTGRDNDGDVDDDDDLAFLDAQIRKERRAEPCYASLLRSTTDAMRQNNPRWAAAQDRGKPARSAITGARRAQLKGALQTRLTEEEKKRGKSSADKGERKS
ncbi:unnamed protein product [Ectocarpus sp. 4 AP-2014]